MRPEDTPDLAGQIAPHLPYLRRFARALTGQQATGDDIAAATLDAILADPDVFERRLDPKVALFRVFHAIWSSAGAPVAVPGEAEGRLAAKAQQKLKALPPRSRVALLLRSLEEFDPAEVAAIMQLDGAAEAEALIAAGRLGLERQTRGRVLIIEDEPVIAMDLASIVAELGHSVVGTVDTRDKAVAAARATGPNLVLADIALADGSSGIDAVREILTQSSVPVIFITAYPERLLTGVRPEPTFLITKPFRDEQLRTAIGQALFFETVVDAG